MKIKALAWKEQGFHFNKINNIMNSLAAVADHAAVNRQCTAIHTGIIYVCKVTGP